MNGKKRCGVYIYIYIHTYTYTYIYNGILLSLKKEWNNAIYSNLKRPRDYHTKWSKSERERQLPYGITFMWNLKYDTSELLYETEIDSQIQRTDLWLPRGMEGWGGMDWEFGIGKCKLWCIFITESLCCTPETNTTL